MTSEQLNLFVITAKHLNFSAAAKELYISQPAVSHQIALLEKELGTRLFVRTTRTIHLTRSGELFLEDAKRILDLEEASKSRIRATENTDNVPLSVCYLLAACRSFLPRVCARLQAHYPQVKLELHRMDAQIVTESMKDQRFDMYFSLSSDLMDFKEYSKKDIYEDTLSLICPEDHPCASLTKIDYNKMASEKFILMDPRHASYMHQQIRQLCRNVGLSPQRISYCDSFEEVLFQVEAGLGVTILPMRSQYMSSESVVYIPFSDSRSQMKLGVAWLMDSGNPAIDWMLEILEHAKANNPEWF